MNRPSPDISGRTGACPGPASGRAHGAYEAETIRGRRKRSGSIVDDGGGAGPGIHSLPIRPTATDEGVAFDDRVPHGCDAERARKVLRATSAGYEETLEIDRGDGVLVPWARIELQREAP